MTRRVVWAATGIAAVGGAFAGGDPSGVAVADVFMSAAWAAVVTLAGSRARRSTTLVLAGVAAICAPNASLMLLAAVAVFLAAGVTWFPQREKAVGAIVAGLSVQVLLRLELDYFFGSSAVVMVVACLPVLVSGYKMARRRDQRRARQALLAVLALALGATFLFGLTVVRGRSEINQGVALANDGLEALRKGDQPRSAELLSRSAAAFERASNTFTSPIGYPARVVPMVGHHAEATATMAEAGADVARAASEAAGAAAYDEIEIADGTVDLQLIHQLEDPLEESVLALERAEKRLASIENPWLLPPVADPLDDFASSVADTLPDTRTAERAVAVAPWLLGEDAPRHYFVVFATPSESRGLGGFMGNYGVLTADAGRVDLTVSGRIEELADISATQRTLTGFDEYLDRYSRYFPAQNLQNVTASPDFPTVAGVLAELYPQTGGVELDGALYVDPYGLAALLELTGPVAVPGRAEPLTAKDAADFLLTDQYVDFPDDEGRADFLQEASDATFDALTSRPLPGPGTIIDILAPAARSGRLLFTTFDPAAEEFLHDQGINGAFPAAGTGDLLSVRSANANPSKIDAYLHRTVDYAVTYDPLTGTVDGRVTVTLRNDAPSAGLPDVVIGNRSIVDGVAGLPVGTNRLQLSLYTPLQVLGARLDEEPLPLGVQPELGVGTYNALVVVPPGATRTVEFDVEGTIQPGPYSLQIAGQALVHPDDVHVAVTPVAGAAIDAATGGRLEDRSAILDASTNEDQVLVVEFD